MTASKDITGNALRVYLYLVTHGACELREVQRGLDLSTPSLASYHLKKLAEAGYVRQDRDGKYFAIQEASTEILELHEDRHSACPKDPLLHHPLHDPDNVLLLPSNQLA